MCLLHWQRKLRVLLAFTHFYPVFSLKEEEPGQETGKKNPSGPPCFSEDTAVQSSGMTVAAHIRCRNWYLEHGTQGGKQGLSNSLKTVALNPSAGYFYLKRLFQSFIVYPQKMA